MFVSSATSLTFICLYLAILCVWYNIREYQIATNGLMIWWRLYREVALVFTITHSHFPPTGFANSTTVENSKNRSQDSQLIKHDDEEEGIVPKYVLTFNDFYRLKQDKISIKAKNRQWKIRLLDCDKARKFQKFVTKLYK